jgi:hypothetical protein
MALTFDATLKDMGRESPRGFLAAFDRPPTAPVRLLNVDLSTVTAAADLILGLGGPLAEIVQLDFQSSAAAGKHADVLAYHVPRTSCSPPTWARCRRQCSAGCRQGRRWRTAGPWWLSGSWSG